MVDCLNLRMAAGFCFAVRESKSVVKDLITGTVKHEHGPVSLCQKKATNNTLTNE